MSLIGLISLSALLLAVSGQLSTLSPSYSFQGTVNRTEFGAQTLTGNASVSVDITRRLRLVFENITTTAGDVFNNIKLTSESDSTTYFSSNGDCTESVQDSDAVYPINTNVWDLYAAGTEDPTGTYTFTRNLITYTVAIVNGVPSEFTFVSGNTVIVTVVANFDNTIPPFSTFSLPSECYKFTCLSCYGTVLFPVLSPSYSLQGTVIRTENDVAVSTGSFSVSVDIDRRLRLVDETLTTTGGVESNNIRLYSAGDTDRLTYDSVNGVCTLTTIETDVNFPIYTDVWLYYGSRIGSPTGIFTFTQFDITHTVTIVNGEPAGFTFTNGTTVNALTVTNFYNSTPTFSTFSLPSECSQFTCNACYSSAVSVSISIMLLLTTLLVYLFTTL